MKLIVTLLLTFCYLAISVQGRTFVNPEVPEKDVKFETRIVGGNLASTGQFPHMCSLTNKKVSGLYTLCGSSIISERHLLTAAHCLVDVVMSTAGCGTVDRAKPYLRITYNDFVIHPDFDPSDLIHNIAIWRSPVGIIFNSDVHPIALPSILHSSQSFEGAAVTLSGFGRNHTNSTSYSQFMHYAHLKVITNKECAEIYGHHIVTDSALCAIGMLVHQQGSCDGDGGSPLYLEDGDKKIQIGIATFTSSQGCEAYIPSGFIRTGSYLPWINNVTGIPVHYT